MARVDGSNAVMSWIAGLLCAGVVAVLIWFALPAVPAMVEMIGDRLRELTP